MADVFPEWIQEQLDAMEARHGQHPPVDVKNRMATVLVMQAGMVQFMSERFDRIEAKLDRLIKLCEKQA